MIQECRCPNCGEYVNNWYENSDDMQWADNDMIFIDYSVHCRCGCKFTYTEFYKLCNTCTAERTWHREGVERTNFDEFVSESTALHFGFH